MGHTLFNPITYLSLYSKPQVISPLFPLSHRAPFGLFYHAAWFTTPHHKEGFIAFLDTITAMDDVWLVTNWQSLQWMRDPTPLSRVKSFGPFQCNYSVGTVCICSGGRGI